MIYDCGVCNEALDEEAIEMGWPVLNLQGELECPDCYGDDAYCSEGHILDGGSDCSYCAKCKATEAVETVDVIRREKDSAGETAYLWLHSSGDCILWPSVEASTNDSGIDALSRWQLSDVEAEALTTARIVDNYG